MKAFLMTVLWLLINSPSQAAREYTEFYHTDASGSIVAASDEQGKLIWKKTYAPYGNEVITTENGDEYEGQAYTGKPYDKETGLLYLGQRYYDPEIKRFISMDPVGFVPSNPTSFNRYAYANNNPYRFIDPDGRQAFDLFSWASNKAKNGASDDVMRPWHQSQAQKDFEITARLSGQAAVEAAPEAIILAATSAPPLRFGVTVGRGIVVGKVLTNAGPTILRSVGAAVNTGMTFTRKQLQKKFASHGDDFAVFGNANNQTLAQFESAILRHTRSDSTLVIQGTYRGTQQVTHFFNPNTALNVIRDADGAFLSGWKLGRAQIENIMRSGNLQ